MTSTSFNVGLGDGSRSSSRVLRPPGGGHTDIFGGEAEPPRGRRAAPASAAALIQGQGDEPAKPTNGSVTPTQNGRASDHSEAPAPAPAAAPTPAPTPAPAAARAPSQIIFDAPMTTPTEPKAPKATTPTEPKAHKETAPAEPRAHKATTPTEPKASTPTDPKCDGPKRVRVPPGGFSSGLW